jgi:hypothetical protein
MIFASKNSLVRVAGALALCLGSSTALAGYTNAIPVYVGTGVNGYGYGSVIGARYSSDSMQNIGCQVYDGSPEQVICYAQNSAGSYVSCSTTDADKLALVNRISSISYIVFYTSNGSCSYLSVDNSSIYLH